MKNYSTFLFLVVVSGCAQPPTAAPVNIPTAQIVPAKKSDAELRADALLADLEKRQIDQARTDRENPPPPPPRLNDFIQQQPASPSPGAAPSVPSSAAAPLPDSPAPTAAAKTGGRDEQWWKDEMRKLQVKLEEDSRLAQAALRQMNDSTLRLTYDQAQADYNTRLAAVQNDRAAIDRLHDEARRANVPPGWLRWP